jgi:hypothetical protein
VHALVIDVSINDMAAAQGELGKLVPQVSSSPGFVAAYWVALDQGKGTSIAVFDSEANAQAMVPPPGGTGSDAVTIERVELGAVIASA